MILLGIETATGPFSVALWKHGKVTAFLNHSESSRQSAMLMPMIEQILTESHTSYNDLTAIACTTGPGSFTGIRVGMSAARGLCLSLGIPGLGFTTLEVMAFGLKKEADVVLSILNAGKGEVYSQCFQSLPKWSALTEATAGSYTQALASVPAKALVAGNAQLEGIDVLTYPRADHLVALAGESNWHHSILPFYIRPPDAKPMDSTDRPVMIRHPS